MANFKEYGDFVEKVTSEPSSDFDALIARLYELQKQVDVPPLLTAGIGLAGEGGEFNEIIKKVVFHGKPLSEEVQLHMAKELGDIIWYWTTACRALGIDPDDVIAKNQAKLELRYGEQFSEAKAENRASGDV